ncbi:MAG: hypothetical protein LBT26_07410 [Clostridiales Family XIII bacterium]|jgi:hypothetical protein|nr:hypothetical protein [Clostridiales Family XIII bacterium]
MKNFDAKSKNTGNAGGTAMDFLPDDFPDDFPDDQSLTEALEEYTKQDLLDIARLHGFSGYSKYRKKSELACFVAENMLLPSHMERFFLNAADEEIALFEKSMAESVSFSGFDSDMDGIAVFAEGAYCFIRFAFEVYVPSDVAAAYRLISTPAFHKKRKRHNLLSRYIVAAVNLYGIVPVETLMEIFNDRNKQKCTVDEFFDVFTDLSYWNEDVAYYQGAFVADLLLASDDPDTCEPIFESLLEDQGDKPFFVPGNDAFLLYSDVLFPLANLEVLRLHDFLVNEFLYGEDDATDICEFSALGLRAGIAIKDAFNYIAHPERLPDERIGEQKGDELLAILIDVWNNTRMLANRGYTPLEMDALSGENGETWDSYLILPREEARKNKAAGKVVPFDKNRKK